MLIPAISRYIGLNPDHNYFMICKSELEAHPIKLISSNVNFFYRHKKIGSILDAIKMLSIAFRLNKKRIDVLYAPLIPSRFFYRLFISIINPNKVLINREKLYKKFKYSFNPYNKFNGHQVEYYQENLLGNFIKKPISFYINSPTKKVKNIIAIGLGCGFNEENKIPDLDWFLKLINSLICSYPNIKINLYGGGKNDLNKFHFLKKKSADPNKIIFTHNVRLDKLIKILDASLLIISGTTGPGHIASLTNRPIITLSNSTNICESGPYSDKIISINLHKKFRCSPCYRENFNNGCGYIKCVNNISVEQVLKYCEKIITEKKINFTKYSELKIKTKVIEQINSKQKFIKKYGIFQDIN